MSPPPPDPRPGEWHAAAGVIPLDGAGVAAWHVYERAASGPDVYVGTFKFETDALLCCRRHNAFGVMLAALEAVRGFGPHGETHGGVSVSRIVDEAIRMAKGGAG